MKGMPELASIVAWECHKGFELGVTRNQYWWEHEQDWSPEPLPLVTTIWHSWTERHSPYSFYGNPNGYNLVSSPEEWK